MVIGHIYRRLGGGGMPRGTGVILGVHHAMGHEIVVFTREPPGDADYEIPVPYRHVVLPDNRTAEPASAERLEQLRRNLLETKCDLVIHHEYYARFAADDLRLLKEMGIPVLLQWHSCFSALNMAGFWDGGVSEYLSAVRRYADGVLTLSRTDRTFFELLGVPAVHVPYSDTDLFDRVPEHGEGHRLLWTGRMYPSKRPVDAVRILELVLEKVPDATLVMLGDGVAMPAVKEYLETRPDLAAHVELPGFVNEIQPYLAAADVFLVTTQYEGFMHSLVEAKMAALPVVGYRMDYIDTAREGTGYVPVEQGDYAAAAAEVVRLLLDSAERRRLGALARKDFEWFLDLDQKALYERAFRLATDKSAKDAVAVTDYGFVPSVLKVLLEHVDMHAGERRAKIANLKDTLRRRKGKIRRRDGKIERRDAKIKRLEKRIRRCKKRLEKRKTKLRALKASRAYRLGSLLLKPFRLIRRVFR